MKTTLRTVRRTDQATYCYAPERTNAGDTLMRCIAWCRHSPADLAWEVKLVGNDFVWREQTREAAERRLADMTGVQP